MAKYEAIVASLVKLCRVLYEFHSNTGFLPICQNQIQGLFKDFQGPYKGCIRRTKLKQTGTFISTKQAKRPPQIQHCQLPQRGLGIRAQETHLVIEITCSVMAF